MSDNSKYWIVLTNPQDTDILPALEGRPWSYDIAPNNEIDAGDFVYLRRNRDQDIYGWGVVSNKPAGQDELINLSVIRTTLFGETLKREELLKTAALNRVASLLLGPLAAHRLEAQEATALNRLIRNLRKIAPPDPSPYASPMRDKILTNAIGKFDPLKADAQYKSFPSFEQWAKCAIDATRWARYLSQLNEQKKASPDLLNRALETVQRAAAIDTGAIEGLYEVDRGFTITVATQAAMWEAALAEKGPVMRAMFEAQLDAYNAVLDLATKRRPVLEAFIRELHTEICRNQETYVAYTEFGRQEHKLPKGQYKTTSNHVIGRDGELHSHAPVEQTPFEMRKLCEELNTELFLSAPPVLQASYAHYAFVAIHPFTDGNGRVARALASIFTYRSHSVPLLILMEDRPQYYESLTAADKGAHQPFVDFIFEKTIDGIKLAIDSLQAAKYPSIEESLAVFKQLYITKGNYTQAQVDEAGNKLRDILVQAITKKMHEIANNTIQTHFSDDTRDYDLVRATSRYPSSSKVKRFLFVSAPPASIILIRSLALEVPKDCGSEDDLLVQNIEAGDLFEARITELLPAATGALQMRIKIWADGFVAEALNALSKQVSDKLKS